MEQSGIEILLAGHPFFTGLAEDQLKLLGGCARNVRFEGAGYLFHENEPADRFYVIRHGHVALELYNAGRGAVTVQTLKEGDVLGWAWLFPPYRWEYDARAVDSVRAVAIDGRCIREKCETDTALGYELMKRLASVIGHWLDASRLQLLDVYCADHGQNTGKDKAAG